MLLPIVPPASVVSPLSSPRGAIPFESLPLAKLSRRSSASRSSADFVITGPGAGTLEGLGSPVSYHSVENLGGDGKNGFHFGVNGKVLGNIMGGNSVDTLDYSGLMRDISVNLRTHNATGVGGMAVNVENVIGGKGDDLIVGDERDNLLIGDGDRNVIGSGGDSPMGDSSALRRGVWPAGSTT